MWEHVLGQLDPHSLPRGPSHPEACSSLKRQGRSRREQARGACGVLLVGHAGSSSESKAWGGPAALSLQTAGGSEAPSPVGWLELARHVLCW